MHNFEREQHGNSIEKKFNLKNNLPRCILSKDYVSISVTRNMSKSLCWVHNWRPHCQRRFRHQHQGQLQNCFTYYHRNTFPVRIAHIVEVLILHTDNHCWHSKHNYDPWHHQDKYTPRLFESRGPIGLESRTKRTTKVSYKGKVRRR